MWLVADLLNQGILDLEVTVARSIGRLRLLGVLDLVLQRQCFLKASA